jgi:diguanylate cyclase (GGDEF)-like protein/PAS domain S-box-containing protein
MPNTETPMLQGINTLLARESAAWVVLLSLLVVTVACWQFSAISLERQAVERFQFRADKEADLVIDRMHDYERVLRGGAALFAASDWVLRDEWHAYVRALALDESLPGVLAMGFARMLPKAELSAHEAAVRAEGFPDYAVRPAGDREWYGSIVYIEPFSGRNLRAFGYDMFSEPVRRQAMEGARDSGQPALSGKVILQQENGSDVQPGFLTYLPVYHNAMPVGTIAERRAALLGFVYSPFRAVDLMQRVFKEGGHEIDIEIFDGAPLPDNLLYAPKAQVRSAQYTTDRQLHIAGRLWTARFYSSSDFEAGVANGLPLLILSAGTLFSLLFFSVLFMNTLHRRQMAETAATLERSRDDFRTLVENVPGTVFRSGPEPPWPVQHISRGIELLTGEPPVRFLSGELSLDELIVADDRPGVAAAVGAAIASNSAYDIEYRISGPGGSRQWVSERGRASYDEAGKPQWLDGVIVDISERKQGEDQLRAAALYARSLIEASLDPLLTISADGKIMDANTATERMTGIARERLIGSDFCSYFTNADDARAGYQQVFSQGYVIDYPLAIRHQSGEVTDILYNASVYRDESGRVGGVLAAARDVTKLKRSQLELEETNREIRLLGQMTDLLLGCQSADEAFPVIEASLAELFPATSGACFVRRESTSLFEGVAFWGQSPPLATLHSADDCWALRRGRLHAVGPGQWFNPHCKHVGDEQRAYLCAPLLAQGKTIGTLFLSADDANESEQRHRRRQRLAAMTCDSISLAVANLMLRDSLRTLSFSDPLTGLFNRRFMEETLARELSRIGRLGEQMVVAMLDVDRFKDFNDVYGHDAGDLVLKKIAETMLAFRQGVDVACRYGGEEFLLILPEISREIASERFEQFRLSIAALELEFNGKRLPQITVSIGAAIFPGDATSAADLIRVADEALYQAKRSGRNRVVIAGNASSADG